MTSRRQESSLLWKEKSHRDSHAHLCLHQQGNRIIVETSKLILVYIHIGRMYSDVLSCLLGHHIERGCENILLPFDTTTSWWHFAIMAQGHRCIPDTKETASGSEHQQLPSS